jgi:hypothetical protein
MPEKQIDDRRQADLNEHAMFFLESIICNKTPRLRVFNEKVGKRSIISHQQQLQNNDIPFSIIPF